jgi:hypothetical protein
LALVNLTIAIIIEEITPFFARQICSALFDFPVYTNPNSSVACRNTREETFIYQGITIIVGAVAHLRVAWAAWQVLKAALITNNLLSS